MMMHTVSRWCDSDDPPKERNDNPAVLARDAPRPLRTRGLLLWNDQSVHMQLMNGNPLTFRGGV